MEARGVKVLVTGVHGFLGHHIAIAARSRGHTVIGTDRVKGAISDKEERIRALAKVGGISFVESNLSLYGNVLELLRRSRPDAIIHAAAQYSVRYTTENMHSYVASNLQAFTYLLEAAATINVRRLAYASSVAVSDDIKPTGLYGATKAYNEHAAHAYAHRKHISSIGLRYGVIYGPMMRKDAEIYRTIQSFCRGERLNKSAQFDSNIAFIHIADAAEIAVRSVESKHIGAAILPAQADDESASYGTILELCGRAANKAPLFPKGHVRTPRGPRVDQSKVMDFLGWKPSIDLDAGIRNYLSWTLKNMQR